LPASAEAQSRRGAKGTNGGNTKPGTSDRGTYLGRLSANPYAVDSTANTYGSHGSRYGSDSIRNPYSRWGSPTSPSSTTNPWTTSAPRLYAEDGTYLGRLSSNPYDPESVSNPYGT